MPTIYSDASTIVYGAATSEECWLKDPYDATNNMVIWIEGRDEFAFEADVGMAAFDVIGRKNAVPVVDVAKGDKFSFKAHMFQENEATFDAMFMAARTLLLQLTDGRQWYIALRRRTKRLVPGTGDFLYLEVECVEVDQPV